MPKLPTSGLLPGAGIAGTVSLLTGVAAVDALQLDFLHEAAENPGMDFDVELYPADPMPGEAVTFRLVNITGIPAGINPYLQTAVMVDFGDPGAVYESGGGQSDDANTAMGRVSAHVYEAAGSYTASFTMHAVGMAPTTKTITVPVVAPAQASFTRDLYVDFGEVSGTPDFGFAPAAGGNVYHISSVASLTGFNLRADGQRYRITFKDGETFTDVTQRIDGDSTYVITRSGGGAKPRFLFSDLADPNDDVRVFSTNKAAGRLVVIGLDADGRYNPLTGIGPAGMVSMIYSYGDVAADRYISIWRCKGRGLLRFYSAGAGYDSLGEFTTHFRHVDNDFADWLDYGVAWFGTHVAPCTVGNRLVQDPLAIQRDSDKYVLPTSPQHGPTRIQNTRWGCDENNLKVGASGWSPLRPNYYVQPCNRYMAPKPSQQPDWEMYMHRNKAVGSCFASVGSVSGSGLVHAKPKAFVITHNEMDTGRQGLGGFVEMDCTGVHVGDNLHYRANVYDFNNDGAYFVRYRTDHADPGAYPNADVFDGEISAMANTIFSDRTALSGGNGAFSLFKNFETWPGALMIESENNLVHALGHENGAAFPDMTAMMDRSSGFKLTADGAAAHIITDDVTVFDLSLALRGDTTTSGANHGGVGTMGAVAAPVNTAPPVIAALAAFPDEFAVTYIGAWSNVDPDKLHLMEYDWRLNGAPITLLPNGDTSDDARYLVNPKLTGSGADQLTCIVTMTNRSGQRVSAQSDPILI